MLWRHIDDHDLERYFLGMLTEECELAPLEAHLLACTCCAHRAGEAKNYVNAMRVAALGFVSPFGERRVRRIPSGGTTSSSERTENILDALVYSYEN